MPDIVPENGRRKRGRGEGAALPGKEPRGVREGCFFANFAEGTRETCFTPGG